QSWPAVNFNFPQVHIDKYDPEEEMWDAFERIVNNYRDGAFLENEVDVEDITYNRNIRQPLPYVLHLLVRGFAYAGYTLHGDIMSDPIFQKKLLYADSSYASTYNQESYNIILTGDDGVPSGVWSAYNASVAITNAGRYRITGRV